MKKILLSAAFLLGAFVAQADYTNYYKVYYNGEEVKSGDTIYCNHYTDNTDVGGYNMGYTYEANLTFVNQTEDFMPLYTTQGFPGTPTEEEFKNQPAVDYTSSDWFLKWGTPSLCYENGYDINKDSFANNCVALPFVAILADKALLGDSRDFQWQFHLQNVDPATVAEYSITTVAGEGDNTDYELFEDGEFTLNVVFSAENNSVDGIGADSESAPEYYTIQGIRVANPEKGLYIVKSGNKVTKQIFK